MTDYILSIKLDGQRPSNSTTTNRYLIETKILEVLKKHRGFEIHLKVSAT